MITALAVAVAIFAFLLCLRTAKYKHVIRNAMDSQCGKVVLMKSFKQFKSMYDIAPEKYELCEGRYYPHVGYKAAIEHVSYKITIGHALCKEQMNEYKYYENVMYELYFEQLHDWLQAKQLLKDRDRRKSDADVEQNQIRRQKEFIEFVRKDLELFEKEGVKEA